MGGEKRPGARTSRSVAKESVEIQREILAANRRRERVLERTVDERWIAELGKGIEVAIALFGRPRALGGGGHCLEQLRVAVHRSGAHQGIGHGRFKWITASQRVFD